MRDKLILIDGHSIINRAFYGMPDLTNSKGVHTGAGRRADRIGQARQFLVAGQCVQRQVHAAPARMGENHALLQLLRRKVQRRRAQPEFRHAAVYGIRPITDRIAQPFEIAGGAQQFRYLQHISFTPKSAAGARGPRGEILLPVQPAALAFFAFSQLALCSLTVCA